MSIKIMFSHMVATIFVSDSGVIITSNVQPLSGVIRGRLRLEESVTL